MVNITATPEGNRGSANQKNVQSKRKLLIAILIVVVLFAALWIWKAIQISNIKREAEKDQQELRANASDAFININLQQAKLWAKPYSWAIRTAMMRGDLSQVNQYAEEMIKEKNLLSIVVADEKGIIVSSTNKKFEGRHFSVAGKPAYLQSDSVIVERSNDGIVTVSAPVMGYNSRIGTLLINYRLSLPAVLQNAR